MTQSKPVTGIDPERYWNRSHDDVSSRSNNQEEGEKSRIDNTRLDKVHRLAQTLKRTWQNRSTHRPVPGPTALRYHITSIDTGCTTYELLAVALQGLSASFS